MMETIIYIVDIIVGIFFCICDWNEGFRPGFINEKNMDEYSRVDFLFFLAACVFFFPSFFLKHHSLEVAFFPRKILVHCSDWRNFT